MATAMSHTRQHHPFIFQFLKQSQPKRSKLPYAIQPPSPISMLRASSSDNKRRKRRKKLDSDAIGGEDHQAMVQLLCEFVKSGCLEEALQVFDNMPHPDTYAWNVMIRGLVENGFFGGAVDFYYRMRMQATKPDNFTFPFVIKACGALTALVEGQYIHANLVKNGLGADLYVSNSLIAMYSKLGLIDSAERLFQEMDAKDLVSWNSILSAYVSDNDGGKVLARFKEMLSYRFVPDRFSIISVLGACSLECSLKSGKELHNLILRNGFEMDIMIQTSVIDMYSKCLRVDYAQKFLNSLPQRSLGSYNALIAGYALSDNNPCECISSLRNMQKVDKLVPDVITLINALPACAQLESLLMGKAFHGFAIRRGFLPHLVLSTALVNMYGACWRVHLAERIFSQITPKSLVSWNTMITAYVQNNSHEEALMLYRELWEDHKPDSITMASILPAYAELASLLEVKQIHGYVVKSSLSSEKMHISNALIYAYAKCGDICTSRKCFNLTLPKNLVTWNTIIMAYALHGFGKESIRLFSQMIERRIEPNKSTFVSLLSSCCSSGLVEEGWKYFDMMKLDYRIEPGIEHYGCMVDLIGRTGNMAMARRFIDEMPLVPTARIWGALLTASRNNNSIEDAEYASDRIFKIQHDNSGCYLLLANMYSEAGRWEEVERIKNEMRREGIQKKPRYTLVEVSGKMYKFVDHDRAHHQTNKIYDVLCILHRKIEEDVFVDRLSKLWPEEVAVERARKPEFHSIRLGVAFGLISTSVGAPVLVKSSVRVCRDCHEAVRKMSQVTEREIVVGDPKVFHHFRLGRCSCGDYW